MSANLALRLLSGAATLVALYLATHAIGAFLGWHVMADAETPEAAVADEDDDDEADDDDDDEPKAKPKIPTVKVQPDARLTRITRFNAFCPTCVPEDAPPPEAAAPALPLPGTGELEFPGAVRTQLPLALVATMEAEAPGISLATISKQEAGITGVYAEGDEVLEQVTLLAVDLGIVYLRTPTRVEYLQVSSDDPPPSPAVTPPTKDKPTPKKRKGEIDGASDSISCSGMSCTVKREFVSQLLANPAILASQGNARPYARDDLKGFRLSRVKKGTVPNLLGLRSGDVITGINGQPLDSLDGAMKLYARLRNASHLTVDLTRNRSGERQELRLDISII